MKTINNTIHVNTLISSLKDDDYPATILKAIKVLSRHVDITTLYNVVRPNVPDGLANDSKSIINWWSKFSSRQAHRAWYLNSYITKFRGDIYKSKNKGRQKRFCNGDDSE